MLEGCDIKKVPVLCIKKALSMKKLLVEKIRDADSVNYEVYSMLKDCIGNISHSDDVCVSMVREENTLDFFVEIFNPEDAQKGYGWWKVPDSKRLKINAKGALDLLQWLNANKETLEELSQIK